MALGEEVVIAKAGKPIARLVRVDPPPVKRVLGTAKGDFVVPEDFDAPLPDEILAEFYHSQAEKLPILSADPQIRQYAVETIW